MNWITYVVLSIVFFTAQGIFQRIVAQRSSHLKATPIAFVSIATAMSVVLFLFTTRLNSFSLPKSYLAYFFLLLATIFYGSYEKLRFKAAAAVDLGTISVISSLSLLVAFLFSLMLYHESANFMKLIGFAMVIVSIVFISYKKSHKTVDYKNYFYPVVSQIILGLGWSLDKKGALYFGVNFYNILVWVLPLMFLLFPKFSISEVVKAAKRDWSGMSLIALFNVIAYYLQLKALSLAPASKVIPLVNLYVITSVLAGMVFLREDKDRLKKILASIIAFAGGFLILAF